MQNDTGEPHDDCAPSYKVTEVFPHRGITRPQREADSKDQRRKRGKIQGNILLPLSKFIERVRQVDIEREKGKVHQRECFHQKPRLSPYGCVPAAVMG